MEEAEQRVHWASDREFLLSCITMSVGLGNVWRFPSTAYENGGGAFLIPYIFILLIVGRPLYLLEMILGQFASKAVFRVWDMVPAFRGIAVAQLMVLAALVSYYCSLVALTLHYLVESIKGDLPWTKCRPEWGPNCVDLATRNATMSEPGVENGQRKTSAEFYFYQEVLHEKENINDGIGYPDLRLTIYLAISWLLILLVLIRGVRSSGKAAYFLALFPYMVMIGLLIRSVTLKGASVGILYFVTPIWTKLLEPNVWFEAVSQCFFSLAVCFGVIIMYSSHNRFEQNVYRDAEIVTCLDTMTSLLSGFTIFGILGNLQHELGTDIKTVVRGGTGLAFISYPEAIAKFTVLPQFFAVIFFIMMFVLGLGTEIGLISGIITVLHDQFPKYKFWQLATLVIILQFSIGLVYITPGGQFIVTFVDFYATSFNVFFPAVMELIAVFYVYGTKNFLLDAKFMLKRKLGWFWIICWKFLTPTIIGVLSLYSLITVDKLKYNEIFYPTYIYAIGWCLFGITLIQFPIWMFVAMYTYRDLKFCKRMKRIFKPSEDWGPINPEIREKWIEFKNQNK